MVPIKRLIQEIHSRSLWQILVVSLGVSWGILEAAALFIEQFGLPAWLFSAALVLLIVGLAVILLLAFVPIPYSSTGEQQESDEALAESRHLLTWRTATTILVVALAAWGVVAAGWLLTAGSGGVIGRRMLVVIPFENLGGSADDYFADGITEEITSRLAQISGLGVIGRSSALQYKGHGKTIRQIGEELGVQYVLDGTVRWEKPTEGNSRVRVTPQLVRVSDGTHLWTDSYDAVLASVFQIQGDIAEQVARALEVTLLDRERRALDAVPTDNLEAYDYYLRGNEYYNRVRSAENYRIAVQLYERAVELDPNFAVAYAKLSLAHSRTYWFFYDRTEERLQRARSAVEAALRLDPELPDAHYALGGYHYWGYRDYDRALQQLALARKGKPNSAEILATTAYVQRRQGALEDALQNLIDALELEPRSSNLHQERGITESWMRRYNDAIRSFDRALSLAPDQTLLNIYKARVLVSVSGADEARRSLAEATQVIRPERLLDRSISGGRALLRILYGDATRTLNELDRSLVSDEALYHLAVGELHGRLGDREISRVHYDSARVLLEQSVSNNPDETVFRAELGLAYAGLGMRAEAVREGEAAVEMLPVARDALDGTELGVYLAEIYAMVGATDAAIDRLEALLTAPGWLASRWLRLDPIWSPLEENERLQELAANGQ